MNTPEPEPTTATHTRITLQGVNDMDWIIANIESDFTTKIEFDGLRLNVNRLNGKTYLEFESMDASRGDVVMVPEGHNQISFRHVY